MESQKECQYHNYHQERYYWHLAFEYKGLTKHRLRFTENLMTFCSRSNKEVELCKLWICYLLFGALHEASHLSAAYLTGLSEGILDDGYLPNLYRTLLGRVCVIPGLQDSSYDPWRIATVRHSGWVFSIAIAILLHLFFLRTKTKKSIRSLVLTAAYTTALEAISTDLMGLGVLSSLSYFDSNDYTLFCGNFGIILLHHAWLTNEGENMALDILEKMVSVTMMRGAQSGGVVTFSPRKNDLVGIRSRVVNKKRTDLSKLIRSKVQRDVFRKVGCHHNPFGNDFVPAFCGHTRFATSSKATFEGTHPQQWTPASIRRVYDFSVQRKKKSKKRIRHSYKASCTLVENYITHNGDFDFYSINGKSFDLETIQKWLEAVTHQMIPAMVDSCAVAGMVDVLRTQGCFGLSARFAICLGLSSSNMDDSEEAYFPPYSHFEKVGMVFEDAFEENLKTSSFDMICDQEALRHTLAGNVVTLLEAQYEVLIGPLSQFLTDHEGGSGLFNFVIKTIDAFFDNDLLHTTKTFMANAKGSFGLCITSSLDANRQLCFAARGQTMSFAFYPEAGLICHGSEQAAVKAGMNFKLPGTKMDKSRHDVDNDVVRLDLDDLGGEICLLDWGRQRYKNPAVSKPNRNTVKHALMRGKVDVFLLQESKTTTQNSKIFHRMTLLTRNSLIKPLREDSQDLILSDIQDIPKICHGIQSGWHSRHGDTKLNRLTAWNLSRCLRKRLEGHVDGSINSHSLDILLTGCEVSLWLAEQFASDLQKSFPKLRIQAVSSNKVLGLFGQDIAVPSVGFPYSAETQKLDDTIVIIVSHSGGTFAPLACSSLLQSTTQNIFLVTSEWDTQVGKQLKSLHNDGVSDAEALTSSRIFSTEVGIRPAEPCSISVAATHQLLTNIFLHISAYVLSNHKFRNVTGAVVTEEDLQILEKCNQCNIEALTNIVGVDETGELLREYSDESKTENELRKAGTLWADHVLENVRAYIMTFVYIFVTVISGYPLMYAIGYAAGIESSSDNITYLIRFLDAAIYFWLPQINIILIRLFQRRNLLHRMVGRTVVIGDIPWVAQSAEAFLSKIFAVSYSIAGLNVLSGNPADHLVHRHTHRVVRGSLLICGRPDGRISALASSESSVCLSVNQASSIQSLGGTCESVTIGHNPFSLPLSSNCMFLPRNRPLFLCERMLTETDTREDFLSRKKAAAVRFAVNSEQETSTAPMLGKTETLQSWSKVICQSFSKRNGTKNGRRRSLRGSIIDLSLHSLDMSFKKSVGVGLDTSLKLQRVVKLRSGTASLGAFMNFEKSTKEVLEEAVDERVSVDEVVERAIEEKKFSDKSRNLFHRFDINQDGLLSKEEFFGGCLGMESNLSRRDLTEIFEDCDADGSGMLDFDEFLVALKKTEVVDGVMHQTSVRDELGMIKVEATREKYFGEKVRKMNSGKSKKHFDFMLARKQHFSQELYESRIASLQRFVAMTVMFHQMGSTVQSFFHRISFGLLGYRMDRTHSIMRIATTASPVSGADIRQQMNTLQLLKKVRHSLHVISNAWLNYKERKEEQRIKYLELQNTNLSAKKKKKEKKSKKERKKA